MISVLYKCSSLASLPEISKWNVKKVKNMSFLFYECTDLKYLPDISKLNVDIVKNMSYLFN